MRYKNIFSLSLLLSISLVFNSCKTKKEIVYTAPEDYIQEELLDTLVISDVLNSMDSLPKVFRPSASMLYDILHTKLDLRFDWQKQHVIGKANLTIKPYFKPINSVELDAVGFDIKEIKMVPSMQQLTYDYTGEKLNINLGRSYTRDEKFEIYIDYIAKPNENDISTGEAITSDKGLFFINPKGEDKEVPMQIWTQGETENNRRWFPTFDKPNERFTVEILLTVDAKYLTLSNGKKVSSTPNADGTRTDYWKQDQPHAPYLTMIAVGDFHEEMDVWNGKPLHYIVEKGFKKHAKKIFNHTPEMLSFFSEKLKYPYPWDKYAQIVVKDFVSGAMENTSAVVFGDFIQKTDRELIDNDNDYIVAHEMMHHWFGDLVTCEDWSNLTLNEGFANYAEYLWFENKYGTDRAEYHRMNEMNGYFSQVYGGGPHPLIHYYYDDKEQMFDAHSYNKGGLVLHMLRKYLGDEAFFAGLNNYLTKNAYTSVEVAELRMAFEDTVGEDLNWFFDQWYLGNGHPHLDVKYTYNDQNKVLLIEVDQSKTPKNFNKFFKLPLDVAIYFEDGSVQYHPVMIEEMNQRILIEDLKAKPVTYVLDGKNVLLALINENKTVEQYKAQFQYSKNFMDKMIAFSSVEDQTKDLVDLALKEKFYLIRSMAIDAISEDAIGKYTLQLQDLALSDLHSEVRGKALAKLLEIEDYDPSTLCKNILDSELAYPVLDVAIGTLGSIDYERAKPYVAKFRAENSDFMAGALAAIMNDDVENLDYLESKAQKIGVFQIFEFYNRYNEFLDGQDLNVLKRSSDVLVKIASEKDGNMYRKYLSVMSLVRITDDLNGREKDAMTDQNKEMAESLHSKIKQIVADETDPTLVEKYGGLK